MPAFLRIELFPSNLQRTVNFYADVLRFTILRQEARYAYLQRDGIFIGFDASHAEGSLMPRAEYRRPPTGVEVVVEVDDLDGERDLVQAKWPLDADVQLQFWGLRDFRVMDPDGYYLRITEHSPGSNGKGGVDVK